jgi:hypothetical protein
VSALRPSFLDEIEIERLHGCPNVYLATHSWICDCDAQWHISSPEVPVRFIECLRCQQGAVIYPEGT